MCLEEISAYLNLLTEQLRKLQVDAAFQEKLISSIEMRIYSLLMHWNDVIFRRGILVVGLEEGLYYEPYAKLEIKCFVVVCIRNSFLETLQSNSFMDAGLTKPLSTKEFQSITKYAVSYFKDINLDALSNRLDGVDTADYYGEITKKYPVTWAVLCHLWISDHKVKYPAVPCEPYHIPELLMPMNFKNVESKLSVVAIDGMDAALDDALLWNLYAIHDGKVKLFYISCFKHLTRNFEKLMRIFEFSMSRGCTIVTHNYFFNNGYIEKRKDLLRAAHDDKDANEQLSLIKKLGPEHKKALDSIYATLNA